MKKVLDILPSFIQELEGIYELEEIKSMSYIAISHYLNFTRSETIIHSQDTLSKSQIQTFNKTILGLKKEYPIQYILSETIFYGLKIQVRDGVLIPRKETEELVEWIIKDNRGVKKSYLDIGTGSACIIIALAKYLEGRFEAIDISKDALGIANKNCVQHNLNINLKEFDIMNQDLSTKWDVIVSNPPYVLVSERKSMRRNVVSNEPEMALFVDDNNPLLYYDRIANQAKNHLNKMGILYFEINEKFGDEIISMLHTKGFVNIELKKDINDKDRMVKAIKK